MSHKEASVLLHEYAVGALNDEELRLVDSHLATGCPECRAELREINEALILLTEADGLIDPPEGLKESVLSKVLAEPQAVPVGVAPRAERSSGQNRSLIRIASGLAIAASLALAALGLPWLVGRPGPGDQRGADAGVRDQGAFDVRLVSLAVPPAEREWLRHVLLDGSTGELHVWVSGRIAGTDAGPTQLEVLDRSGASVALVQLDAGDGVYGAVIAAPSVPTGGTLRVWSGTPGEGGAAILESSGFEVR